MDGSGTRADPGGGPPEFVVRVKAGETIFREGDAGDHMFIIKTGEVEILKQDRGRDQRVALLEEGDFFGEMAILEDQPRMASVRAVTDCDLLRIDSSTFDQMVRHNPEIPVRMLRKLSRRLRQVAAGAVRVDEGSQVVAQPATTPAPPTSTPAGPPARIVHPVTGKEFTVGVEDDTYIGRVDPATGFHPAIELKEIDPQRSTSRRHARISRRGDRFFVREEIGVSNGTFVNGQRLAPGIEVDLNDGDELRFGLVKTVFRIG